MPHRSPPLLPLPFGERQAICFADARQHGEVIERVFPGLNGYDPLGQPVRAFAKSVTLAFPSITLVASAMAPRRVEREGRQDLTLMLPLVGQCSVEMEGRLHQWGAGQAGVLLPEYDGHIVGDGDNSSLVMLRLNADVLAQTARTMLGQQEFTRDDLQLDRVRLIPLSLHGQPFEGVMLQLGKLIDLFACNTDLLALQGYEDVFNRLVVGLLCPERFVAHAEPSKPHKTLKQSVTDTLCEDMLANLGQKITLTELERKSGYSARALQYAFKHRFGCSPMEWLREQRLQLARRRLLVGDYQTMAKLAHDCGFGTASQFSTLYKARFGEAPSWALK